MGIDALIRTGYGNIELIEEMYAKFLEDPNSVDSSWRTVFSDASGGEAPPVITVNRSAPADLRVDHLIQTYRNWGHLKANINPIRTRPIQEPWQLCLEAIGFSQDELNQAFPTNGLFDHSEAQLKEIIEHLEKIYCSKIGIEYMAIQDLEMQQWLQKRIEPTLFKADLNIDQKKSILQHLNKSELFEVFLHTKYVGQKRFSLEGGETLIPILAAIIETGAGLGLEQYVIGMAHRGRLNVLSNILNKSYSQIFSEFEEGYIPLSFEGSGDVKYHKGFSSIVEVDGLPIDIVLAPNPSHLEAVNPVVLGQVRAIQVKTKDYEQSQSVPILVHGDAAVAGQGIIYETMQFYNLNGYSTGGTIHVVINNQIGFTTVPDSARSTHYCSDIARTFNAPVFHVNAEDPEGCIAATNLAIELRQKFHCDVFIDINCYRKFGHNEGDEPAFTQPHEYQLIRSKTPIRELYRDDLIHQGVLERKMAEALEVEFKDALQSDLTGLREDDEKSKKELKKKTKKKEYIKPVKTAVNLKTIKTLGEKVATVPEGVTIHRKLQRVLSDRLEMAKGIKLVDWGMGEMLAYASLLDEGHSIRLSGQDSCRGTFSHRHAVWVDQKEQMVYSPLQNLGGRFDVYNSPLSEYAVLGFEFGYSLILPETLVIWEAQFGDFCNGAQVIIDQFISTAEMKWGQKSGVALFLPHGYEGQGPEHSSGRMERFLALCGEKNMQVINPTSPSQLFHLLRRQMLQPVEKPLIVFTPKGLLRHPECVSPIEAFSKGSFEKVIDDPVAPEKVKKLVFCCGRIFYDLLAERRKRCIKDFAIIRVEQLYPLPEKELKAMIAKYKGFKECYWVQEEPENMGAWDFIRPFLRQLLPKKTSPNYIGRSRSASPAAGSFALHQQQHKALIEALFGKKESKS